MIAIFLLAFTLSLFSFGTTPAAAGDVAGVSTHLFLTVLRDYDHDAAFSVTYTDALGTHTKPYHAGMEVTAWSPVTITCTNHHVHDWSIDADVQEATIVGVGGITYPGGTGIHVKGTNTIKAFATNFGLHYINIVVILGEGNDNGGDNGGRRFHTRFQFLIIFIKIFSPKLLLLIRRHALRFLRPCLHGIIQIRSGNHTLCFDRFR